MPFIIFYFLGHLDFLGLLGFFLIASSFSLVLPHYEFHNCHHTTFDSFAGMDTDSDDYFGDGSDLVDLALGQGLNCWVWPHWPNWVVTIVRYQDCFGNVP